MCFYHFYIFSTCGHSYWGKRAAACKIASIEEGRFSDTQLDTPECRVRRRHGYTSIRIHTLCRSCTEKRDKSLRELEVSDKLSEIGSVKAWRHARYSRQSSLTTRTVPSSSHSHKEALQEHGVLKGKNGWREELLTATTSHELLSRTARARIPQLCDELRKICFRTSSSTDNEAERNSENYGNMDRAKIARKSWEAHSSQLNIEGRKQEARRSTMSL